MRNAGLDKLQAGIKIAGRNINNLRYANDGTLMAESKEELKKTIYLCFIDYSKAFDLWIIRQCGKLLKKWEYQTTWPASWETCMQVRKQQLGLEKQYTDSKQGKEHTKAAYCHPAYLT